MLRCRATSSRRTRSAPIGPHVWLIAQALLAHVSADDYVLPSTSKYATSRESSSDVHRAYKAYAKQRSKHSRQSTSASSSGTSTPVANPATPAKLGDADDGLSPLSDRERCFLSREQLQRFLRAVKWDLNAVCRRPRGRR